MTQVRVIDDRLAVHAGTDVSSPIVAELRAGDEFTLGEVVEVSGVKWATATLLNGKGGYVPGEREDFADTPGEIGAAERGCFHVAYEKLGVEGGLQERR